MLTDICIQALPVDEEAANQDWDAWDKMVLIDYTLGMLDKDGAKKIILK